MENHVSKTKLIRLVSGSFTLLLMGVIFFFSAQPGEASDETSVGLIALLFGQDWDVALLWNALARKAAHMLEFGALAVPVWCFFGTFRLSRRAQFWISTGFCALYAVSDEVHQLFVEARSCEIGDVLVDSLGALAAVVALCLPADRLRKRKALKHKSEALSEADQLVLDAFSSYVTGRPMTLPVPEEQFSAFFVRSFAHKILPMTAQAVMQSGAALSAAQQTTLKQEAAAQLMRQVQRTETFLRTYRAMREAGTTPLCVKGIVCRSLYPEPDLRISADEDLLTREEDFDRCTETLLRLGFTARQPDNGYEVTFFHPESGCMVELHRSLFPEDGGVYSRFNALLGDLFRAPDTVTVNGTGILCPAPTDHLLYMVLHAFKHFLIAGVGIRQLADIAVFARHNTIDWPTVFEKCDTVRLAGFLSAVLRIGADRFGLDVSGIRSPLFDASVDAAALLDDVMAGGVYGSRNTDHRRSGNLTFKEYAAALGQKKTSFLSALFPQKETMRRRYAFAARHGWLLPAAYFARIFGYLFTRHDTARTFATAESRSELMRQYGIF